MKRDDSVESKGRRSLERNAALKVYTIWAWIERQEIKALKEGTYLNRLKIKKKYPLYTELGYYDILGFCPWCGVFATLVTDSRLYRERGNYYQTKCSDCPLNLADNCCDGPIDVLWKRWLYYDVTDSKHASEYAGEIARIAWAKYKRLGG